MPSYRIQYSKQGPAKYISHLDLLRCFERAGRRAGLPLAFTQGYNPHPKISFAAPLGVGIAGEAEYADLELTAALSEQELFVALSDTLPEGLRLLEVRAVLAPTSSLMAAVDRATYCATAKLDGALVPGELEQAITSFLALPEIWVERKGRNGKIKEQDIRPGIFMFAGRTKDDTIILEAELKAGSNGNVRLEEVLNSFLRAGGLSVKNGFMLSRTGLFAKAEQGKKPLW